MGLRGVAFGVCPRCRLHGGGGLGLLTLACESGGARVGLRALERFFFRGALFGLAFPRGVERCRFDAGTRIRGGQELRLGGFAPAGGGIGGCFGARAFLVGLRRIAFGAGARFG
ncbi:MAG: hypothetical protein WA190_12115, partial [Usitatibacter sp.]